MAHSPAAAEEHFRAVAGAHSPAVEVAHFRGVEVARSHGAGAEAQPPAVVDDSHVEQARLPDEMNSADETPVPADDH